MDAAISTGAVSDAPGRPVMLVIAGMHRSGTSALARSCNLLGVDLGAEFIPDQPDNRSGFWEDARVKDTDDLALASFGLLWDDVRALPDPWQDGVGMAEIRERLRGTLAALASRSALCGVKDPRISRLLPLWLPLLEEVGVTPAFVIALRDPLEVAHSLERRDGLTAARAQLLWLRYSLEAERHTRGRRRTFVCFDDLLRDWRATLSRAALDLGITWPVAIDDAAARMDTFLDPSQRHHVAARESGGSHSSRLGEWASDAYVILRAMRDDDSAEHRAALDRLREALAAADVVLGPVLAEIEAEVASGGGTSAEIDGSADLAASADDRATRDVVGETRSVQARELDRARRQVLVADALVRRRDGELAAANDALAAERDQRAREVAQSAQRLAALEAEIATLRDQVAALQRERDAARDEVAAALRVLADVEGSLSWRVTSPLRALNGALRTRRGS